MSSITVLLPNARRCTVKVSSGRLISEIVEEACMKHGFEVNQFVVHNQNRIIDLSLPFRLSGLSNNATLELRVAVNNSVNEVEIALQMEDGRRSVLKLKCCSTLADVLTSFSAQLNENLNQINEDGYPSCLFMNKQYAAVVLSSKTLSSIGLTTGKGLIRYRRVKLSQEEIEELKKNQQEEATRKQALAVKFEKMKVENEEAERLEAERMKKFEADLKEAEKRDKDRAEAEDIARTQLATAVGSQQSLLTGTPTFARDRLPDIPTQNSDDWSFNSNIFHSRPAQSRSPSSSSRLSNLNRLLEQVDNSLKTGTHSNIVDVVAERGTVPVSQILVANEVMEVDAPVEATVMAEPCPRNAVTFMRSEMQSASGMDKEETSEEFFEVGVQDLKTRQRELRQEVAQQTQRALLPKSFIDKKNREGKMNAYVHTVLRFTIGTRIVQANFNSGEPAARLYDFISSILYTPVPFVINFALNVPIVNSGEKNLIDVNVAPKTTLFVKFKQSVNYDTIIASDQVKECVFSEAEDISREWLNINTVFTPFNGVIVAEEPRGVPSKRISDSSHSFAQPPQKSSLPRWLKKS